MDAKCKICRRAGTKLFLKGDKCFTPKCPMTLKPYPPGKKKKKKRSSFSEYAKELKEKQKLRNWYGLRERQFSNYVQSVLNKVTSLKKTKETENAENVLIRLLENRLDNVVFRLGFASSRRQARQLVSHNHFLVNNRPVDIPSFQVKKGDKIKVKSNFIKSAFFQKRSFALKKYKTPSWLKLDTDKWEGEVIGLPNMEEVAPPADILSIFEFYSR